MVVTLKMTFVMEFERTSIPAEECIMENGKMTNGMAKAYAHSMTKYRMTENVTKQRTLIRSC